jgi:hypothetical protein
MPDGIRVLTGSETTVNYGLLKNNLVSYLGRIIYSFADKYTLTGTLRRDHLDLVQKPNGEISLLFLVHGT